MNTTRVLETTRRWIAQTDLTTSDYTDSELLEYMRDAKELMELRKVTGIETLTIDPTLETITPDPTTEQGHMLALKTAYLILDDEYRSKLFTGSLGMSWRSGLEQESTITAEKAWRQILDNLHGELEILVLVMRAPTNGTRPQ